MTTNARSSEQRPSPEALLEAARREESQNGRLKIFVGAAPGVGKTYAMLENARAKLKAGIDVVVGAVETHGRQEPRRFSTAWRSFPAGGLSTATK
jgi:two-component system sensor histidine kinase KdpD